MKKPLQFAFTVQKENNTIIIKREFDAPLQQVWRAWSTPELLDKWWGPRPWKAETKSMDFSNGGRWHYSMNGPEGEKHWAYADYIKIVPEKSIYARDAFSDENGTVNTKMPQNFWEIEFSETGSHTLLDMLLTFDSPEDLETNLTMGFREGFTQGLEQLDELLAKQK